MATAQKSKSSYHSSLAGAANLLNVIESTDEWSWAKPAAFTAGVRNAKGNIHEFVNSNNFASDFLTLSINDVRARWCKKVGKKTDSQKFFEELQMLSRGIDTLVKALQTETAVVIGQSVARRKVLQTS